MALEEKFDNLLLDLKDFADILSKQPQEDNVHALQILRIELDYNWSQVRRTYETCRDYQPSEAEKQLDKNKLRERHRKALEIYKWCLCSINTQIDALSNTSKDERPSEDQTLIATQKHHSMKLPALDIKIFYGDYKQWPSFRDLFTAGFINSGLEPVEKLLYLQKFTGGEAREIIVNAPLTNEGYSLAWKNLTDRYENKRMLINEQLKLLFNLPSVSTDSSGSVKTLQRTINSCIHNLNSFEIQVKQWDPILIYLCSTKLPRSYLEDFEKTLDDSSKLPKWTELDNFLDQKFKTLESVGNVKNQASKYQQPKMNNHNFKDKRFQSFQTNIIQKNVSSTGAIPKQQNTQQIVCPNCRENHFLYGCPSFTHKSVNDRIHTVKLSHSCYNCLRLGHSVQDCPSKVNCRKCQMRHNTLLCKNHDSQSSSFVQRSDDARPRNSANNRRFQQSNFEPRRDETRPSTSVPSQATCFQTNLISPQHDPHATASASTIPIQSTPHFNPDIQNVTTLNLREANRQTLLFTAIVTIESEGQSFEARAIIDSGSQSTFISEKLKNRLKLPTHSNIVHVSGLSPNIAETSTKSCLFNLKSRLDPNFSLEMWAPVLKTLPSNIPPRTISLPHLNEILALDQLADPLFNVSRSIDILIGLDIGPAIYSFGVPLRSIGSLIAQKTVFGWIVGGPIANKMLNPRNTVTLCNTTTLDQILTKFFEVEETPKRVLRSADDTLCETIYRATTKRHTSGRYMVTLPFKIGEEVGTSRNIAMAQFLRMEKMLSTKPDIKEQYHKVILEYLELGHMRKISHQEIYKNPCYYLPHHAVIKPDRVTTKLRVVFNASCPTSNKKSLNDILHTGPVLQQDLVIQTLKWRFFKYVYNADITKMYRQIMVDPSQTQYQRILFRSRKDGPIEDFELLTVTFGVNCAPFLAIRTLLQLAEDVQESQPLAAKILKNNMYVDDVLAGGHTLEEAITSRSQLTNSLESAGFKLAKWTSNNPKILKDINHDSLLSIDCLELSENLGTKTLGIKWWISSDSFSFPTPVIDIKPAYSKREVLSIIAKFFDPCGWLAPVIVVAKLIMQQVWLDKADWDDTLKPLTNINWQNFVKNCHLIETLRIPRWIHYTPWSKIEVHGFCDSSEKAYSAALYIRIEERNLVHTFLLTAKTRVAPIKKLSLPRLELCGAVLLAKLAASVLPNLEMAEYSKWFWTDSTIVLAWLKKPACTWNTFVGNRIAEIHDKVGTTNWRHIDSKDNPADVASRGCSPMELKSHTLWWHGPSWLKFHKEHWPADRYLNETTLEAKPIKVLTTAVMEDPLERFSSLARAYRTLAYVFRFWRNRGKPKNHSRIVHEITAEEIKYVQTRLILLTQQNHFPNEYKLIKNKQKIPTTSTLLTLNPFIESSGIVRANGRLVQSSSLTYGERHPIILPYNSRFTKLLVEHTHKITLHGGNQLMVRVLRTEFWIFRLKPLVKQVIHNCKTCILYKKHTQTQIMASLPPERTTISRPFTHTGVDFAGPLDIRNFTGRACRISKGYVCVFVCFATKAIHLEPTTDLSTQSFLAAFARFIGRRGCPATIHSDNGTNFVGAAEILKKDRLQFMKNLQSSLINNYSHQHVEWKFIPPGAPHMGGLWEAGVKSFKTHLRKLVPNLKFTFEELATILTKIESCLNSRPLSPASDDPNDLSPLTPGNFLIGSPLLTPAEPDLTNENLTLANRWRRLKIIHHNFCQRWKSEYLNELHRRYKWKYQQDNLQVNDLVVLKDNNLPPNAWKLGRIARIYPGVDTNTRVISVRTVNGTIQRPITKKMASSSNRRSNRPSHWRFACQVCKEDHPLRTCVYFTEQSASRKYEVVKKYGYCLNCLACSHEVSNCVADKCRKCNKSHHTLLHEAPQIQQQQQGIKRKSSSPEPFFWAQVFRPTAIVKITTLETDDTWHTTRALVCPSNDISRISPSLVSRMKLQITRKSGHEFAKFRIRARQSSNRFNRETFALIDTQLPRKLYSRPLTQDPTKDFAEDSVADPNPRDNTPIHLEIGPELYEYLRIDGPTETNLEHITANRTVLGYIFTGTIGTPRLH